MSVEPPVIVWFRRDLRLSDHAALRAAAERPVIPVYIRDDGANAGRPVGAASRWWLHHSLAALDADLRRRDSRLILRQGNAAEVLAELASEVGATAIHCSRTYGPAAAQDTGAYEALASNGVALRRFAGGLLFEPESIETKAGTPFRVFTPFWRACLAAPAPSAPFSAPDRLPPPSAWPASDSLDDWRLLPKAPDWAGGLREIWRPGEQGAIERAQAFIDAGLADYGQRRDRPDLSGTSMLSPHLSFGEISPRQLWHGVQAQGGVMEPGGEAFLREIGWREFCHHLLHHWPEIDREPFQPAFADFPWREDATALECWQKGKTGYPLVDAGMRQLWYSGWMHNRVRMVVASFLTKHLLLHWRHGEAWFWDTLVDADAANNPAGWQWVAGSGADASPYFRIFNPIAQSERFDPHGSYVRRWVPELARLPDKYLHAPWTAPDAVLADAGVTLGRNYPRPLVDHGGARRRALDAYAEMKE